MKRPEKLEGLSHPPFNDYGDGEVAGYHNSHDEWVAYLQLEKELGIIMVSNTAGQAIPCADPNNPTHKEINDFIDSKIEVFAKAIAKRIGTDKGEG